MSKVKGLVLYRCIEPKSLYNKNGFALYKARKDEVIGGSYTYRWKGPDNKWRYKRPGKGKKSRGPKLQNLAHVDLSHTIKDGTVFRAKTRDGKEHIYKVTLNPKAKTKDQPEHTLVELKSGAKGKLTPTGATKLASEDQIHGWMRLSEYHASTKSKEKTKTDTPSQTPVIPSQEDKQVQEQEEPSQVPGMEKSLTFKKPSTMQILAEKEQKVIDINSRRSEQFKSDVPDITLGLEFEMLGISQERTAEVVASVVGGRLQTFEEYADAAYDKELADRSESTRIYFRQKYPTKEAYADYLRNNLEDGVFKSTVCIDPQGRSWNAVLDESIRINEDLARKYSEFSDLIIRQSKYRNTDLSSSIADEIDILGTEIAKLEEVEENVETSELVTPILTPEDKGLLTKVLNALVEEGAFTNGTCGLHIHVGAEQIGPSGVEALVQDRWNTEDPELSTVHQSRQEYTRSLKEVYDNKMPALDTASIESMKKSIFNLNPDRYAGVNLQALAKHGTVELRYFNGTVDSNEVNKHVDKVLSWVDNAYLKSREKAVA